MQQLPCVPLFSACGFSPLIQNHVCRSTVVLISLLCCLWFQETLFALPEAPAEFMGKWATPNWAWALQPWRSFSPAKATGSGEDAESARTCHDKTGGRWTFCWGGLCSLTLQARGTAWGTEHGEAVGTGGPRPSQPSLPAPRSFGMSETGHVSPELLTNGKVLKFVDF